MVIGPDVRIGSNCKIQNNVSVYKGVTLEDDVFCGPSMVFTNVVNPRAAVSRRDEFKDTLVKRGATIGANATIVCGVTLGEYSLRRRRRGGHERRSGPRAGRGQSGAPHRLDVEVWRGGWTISCAAPVSGIRHVETEHGLEELAT